MEKKEVKAVNDFCELAKSDPESFTQLICIMRGMRIQKQIDEAKAKATSNGT